MGISFEEARKLTIQEDMVQKAYNTMLSNAHNYFAENTISTRSEEDQIMFRKVAVCDHMRATQPLGTPYMTDEQIIYKLQELEEKYERKENE